MDSELVNKLVIIVLCIYSFIGSVGCAVMGYLIMKSLISYIRERG